jgi:hypothetical protein
MAAGYRRNGDEDMKTTSLVALAAANSICAFSGLNDNPAGAPGNPPGRVQNYGHTMQLMDIIARFFNPGDACNPNAPEADE